MVTWYWTAEYIRVLAGYVFLMFIWPSFMLRKYLRGRSTSFVFAFCVTFQPVLINTVVIVLGLFHLLNAWVVKGLFYIPFLIEVLKWLSWGKKEGRNLKHLLNGTYGGKMFFHNVLCGIGKRLRGFFRLIRERLYKRWWEYGLLSVIIVYGMIYFSWGIFQNYSYGAGDLYVHNAWIYGLVQGQIFSAGVYPEGMHCFIYGLHTLFGVRIYSCMLFLQPIHVAVFLLSIHIFLKEVFHWKYTSMFVLAAFLTLDVVNANAVFSMARLQWTLPQEFGTHTVFLCAAFLVRYLRSTKHAVFRGEITKGYWDENLLIFALSLAASLTIHFYPTIMAFFLCVAFVPVHLKKIFTGKRFVPLVAAVLAGVAVAVLPMVGALASGIPFQGSIGWAMGVIEGTKGEGRAPQQTSSPQQTSPPQQSGTGTASGQTPQGSTAAGDSGQQSGAQGGWDQNYGASGETNVPTEPVLKEPEKESLTVRLAGLFHRLTDVFLQKWQVLYSNGYVRLFREERARLVLGVTLLAVLIWICYRIPAGFLKLILRRKKKKPIPEYFDGYLSVVIASLIFMVMFCGPSLGLPALVETTRLCVMDQILVLAVAGVSLDVVFSVLRLAIWEGVLKVVSAWVVMGIYLLVVETGNFHGFLFVHLTRLNGAVLTTLSITETLPPYSFTIVSPTDELYQQIQYGWHEELSGFVNQIQEEEYTLPSEHIFIFIEKTPFKYAQYHLASGPSWLAEEKYMNVFGSSYASQKPDFISSELLPVEEFGGTQYRFDLKSSTYSVLSVRTLVESLAYQWCQEFAALYPGELQTYYEDENFICYYIRQNPQSVYKLSILYQREGE